ncbi:hypothetical protein BGX38DRAFT_1145719 [Terfezia claveryi]|nr:hypothetical protein BGX38DRAFT_1145719 [Terfezia claveryi]
MELPRRSHYRNARSRLQRNPKLASEYHGGNSTTQEEQKQINRPAPEKGLADKLAGAADKRTQTTPPTATHNSVSTNNDLPSTHTHAETTAEMQATDPPLARTYAEAGINRANPQETKAEGLRETVGGSGNTDKASILPKTFTEDTSTNRSLYAAQ